MTQATAWMRSRQGSLAALVTALVLLGAANADAAKRMGVRVDERGAKVVVHFSPRRQAVERSITLNGRHVEDSFAGTPPAGRRVVLSLREGLKFGRNVLRMRALYLDGKVVKVERRFNVDPRRPLVGIVGDRRLHEGVFTALRVRKAKLRPATSSVRYTWELLDKPDGAGAKIQSPHAHSPQFRPDDPGLYRLGLTATRVDTGTSRTAVAPLLVESKQATKAGVFVGMTPLDATTQGDPTAVQIFGGSIEGTYPIGAQSSAGPILNLIVDRCTLTQIGDPLYIGTGGADVESLSNAVTNAQQETAKAGCTPLVITAGANYGDIGALGLRLDNWTGQETENFSYQGLTQPFWAIWSPAPLGSPASTPGSGWTDYPYFDGGSPAGRMAGELVPDQSGNYVFRQSTVAAFGEQNAQLPFHMDSSGITVPQPGTGSATFPSGTPGCPGNGHGGFQLLVLGASGESALEPIDLGTIDLGNGLSAQNGDTLWVNGCTPAEGELWANALEGLISAVGTNFNDYPTTIFLQGVGNALPPANEMTPDQILDLVETASIIRSMGGSSGAFWNNPSALTGPGYSFVGQSWPLPGGSRTPAEVSSASPGSPPAQLDGFLKPDEISRLAPSTATALGSQLGAELQIYRAPEIASSAIDTTDFTPTPFPGAGNQEWEAAMYYLSKNVFKPALTYDADDACYRPQMDSNNVVYDIRSMYCGGGDSNDCGYPWSAYATTLADKPAYVAGNGFDAGTWNAVIQQLNVEFPDVEAVNCSVASFQTAYGSVENEGFLQVDTMVTDINTYIKKRLQTGDILAIIGDSFEIVASFANVMAAGYAFSDDPGAGRKSNIAWTIQGVIDLGESLGALGYELYSVLKPLPANTTATAYASALEGGLRSTSAALVIPRNQIVSDWARLQAYNDLGLDVESNDVKGAETTLSYASYDRIWKQMLPGLFKPAHLNVNQNNGESAPIDVPTYQCRNAPSLNLPGTSQPFLQFTPNTYTQYPEGLTSENMIGVEAYALAGNVFKGGFYEPVPAPDTQVLGPLFSEITTFKPQGGPTPVSNGTATPLGVNKDQFYADVIESAKAANPSQVVEVGAGIDGYCPTD